MLPRWYHPLRFVLGLAILPIAFTGDGQTLDWHFFAIVVLVIITVAMWKAEPWILKRLSGRT